jgi:hypothetical protein
MPFADRNADAANRLLVRAARPAKTMPGVPRNIVNVWALLFKARVKVRRGDGRGSGSGEREQIWGGRDKSCRAGPYRIKYSMVIKNGHTRCYISRLLILG